MSRRRGTACAVAVLVVGLAACGGERTAMTDETGNGGAFASDVAFLQQHSDVVVLGDAPGARVVVSPAHQGRVLTSTTGGPHAPSFGWIGRDAIASGEKGPHMNAFGGEDRFWVGPEGGQFSLYFKPGDPFDLEHWHVPEAFDWGAWAVSSQSPSSVTLRKRMSLVNYSKTTFDVAVEREVRLVPAGDAREHLGGELDGGVRLVAFESVNRVTNAGARPWEAASGLISIWILGMFQPSPSTTIVIPFVPGPEASLGPIVNDAYFGKVPADRLAVRGRTIFFKGDGRYRSKIGLSPQRAEAVAGSYDAGAQVLTLVQYTRPPGPAPYVNSMWEIQRDPYSGDVINSYNDGPPEPGTPPLGPFYELETSSPALALEPGESYTHVHRTFHLTGEEAALDRLARRLLGVPLAEITDALGTRSGG